MSQRYEVETSLMRENPLSSEKEGRGIPLTRFLNQLFINELYPGMNKPREVSPMIMHLVREVEPLCQPNPTNPESVNVNFIVRGSSIKRYGLGTPPAYWQISEIFQRIPYSTLAANPLSQAVVDNLAKGPRDVDIRYNLQLEKTDQDVQEALKTSLIKDHFTEREGQFYRGRYRARIVPAILGGAIGPKRTFYSVEFYYREQYMMRADFGRLASHLEDEEDFRLSSRSSGLDLVVTGKLSKVGKTIFLKPAADLAEFLKKPDAVRFVYSPTKFTNTFLSLLRGIVGNLVFWPKRASETKDQIRPSLTGFSLPREEIARWNLIMFDQDYSLAAIFNQLKKSGHFLPDVNDPQLLSWEGMTHSQQLGDNEMVKLQQRRREFASQFLLYLTYDPGLFLTLAFELHFLRHVPLGKIIDSREKLNMVLANFAQKLGLDREDYLRLPESNLPLMSYLYKQDRLINPYKRFKHTGSMMLLQVLKELNLLKAQVPENVETIVSLVDPLSKIDINSLQPSIYLPPDLSS